MKSDSRNINVWITQGKQKQTYKLRGFFLILVALFYNFSRKTQPNQKARWGFKRCTTYVMISPITDISVIGV